MYTCTCAQSVRSRLTPTFTNLLIKLWRVVILMSPCPSPGLLFLSFVTMVWYICHSTFPTLSWCTHLLRACSKCPTLLSSPPGKKALGPFPAVSQCSFPTANLPGGKTGLFAPDDCHSNFTQLTATLTTSKEPVSHLRLNFHKPSHLFL